MRPTSRNIFFWLFLAASRGVVPLFRMSKAAHWQPKVASACCCFSKLVSFGAIFKRKIAPLFFSSPCGDCKGLKRVTDRFAFSHCDNCRISANSSISRCLGVLGTNRNDCSLNAISGTKDTRHDKVALERRWSETFCATATDATSTECEGVAIITYKAKESWAWTGSRSDISSSLLAAALDTDTGGVSTGKGDSRQERARSILLDGGINVFPVCPRTSRRAPSAGCASQYGRGNRNVCNRSSGFYWHDDGR